MPTTIPPLLQARSTDEYAPLPRSVPDLRAIAHLTDRIPDLARALGLPEPVYAYDRRGTAATLRAVDAAHGGGFFSIPSRRRPISPPRTPHSAAGRRSSTSRPT